MITQITQRIPETAIELQKTLVEFSLQWIRISLVGWARIAVRLLRFQARVMLACSPLLHGFVAASFAVGILPVFGWFRYSLSLGATETYEITTSLWYLFFVPGVVGLALAVYPFRRAYSLQMALSGSLLLLYWVAYFFPSGFHYEMRLQPDPTVFFYAYPVALVLQAGFAMILRTPQSGILHKMRDQWKSRAG